jgi:hypothetical protein
LKEHAWKACVGETLPWVRIPLSPPVLGVYISIPEIASHQPSDKLPHRVAQLKKARDNRFFAESGRTS